MDRAQLSARQFMVLVILYTIGTTILVIPSTLAADAGHDAWVGALAGMGLTLGVAFFYCLLGSRFHGKTWTGYLVTVYGKWLGKALSLCFVFYAFVGAATVLHYMGYFITSQVMVYTPIQAIFILFITVVAMGLRLGLEAVARTGEILLPWIVAALLLLAVGLLPEMEIRRIHPLFESGARPILRACLDMAGTASFPLVLLLMVFPRHVQKLREARIGFLIGAFAGGAVLVMMTFLAVTVLGETLAAGNVFPSYDLAKKISIGHFLERVEILVAVLWMITVYYKTVFYLYGFVAGLAEVLHLRDYRPLVLPSAMMAAVMALVVYPNAAYLAEFDSHAYLPYVLTFGVVLPILTWVVDVLRTRTRQSKEGEGTGSAV